MFFITFTNNNAFYVKTSSIEMSKEIILSINCSIIFKFSIFKHKTTNALLLISIFIESHLVYKAWFFISLVILTLQWFDLRPVLILNEGTFVNLDHLILIRSRGRFKINLSCSFGSKKEKFIKQYLGVLNLLIQLLLTYLINLTNLL